jgi:cytochrome c553
MFTHKLLIILLLLTATFGVHAQSKNRVAPEAVQLCVSCHIQTAEQRLTIDAQMVPMLGGQQRQYLANALDAYSRRQRDHFFMRGVAAGLTDQQQRDAIEYFAHSTKTKTKQAAKQAAMPPLAGRCVACHGNSSQRPITEEIPVLAGQHAIYISKAFQAYATGGRKHPVMQGQATSADGQSSLNSEDLSAIAVWFSRLPNGLSSE